MKKITKLGEFLTDAQIRECQRLKTARAICEKVIEPNINTINRKLGQENDPMYLAYLVEYAISIVQGRS